jgi:hypothetical protein
MSPMMPQEWHALASFHTKLAAAHLSRQIHRRCEQQAQHRQRYMLHLLACIGHRAQLLQWIQICATFKTLPDTFLASCRKPSGSLRPAATTHGALGK